MTTITEELPEIKNFLEEMNPKLASYFIETVDTQTKSDKERISNKHSIISILQKDFSRSALAQLILRAFSWGSSRDGHSFWEEIYGQLLFESNTPKFRTREGNIELVLVDKELKRTISL